MVLPDVLLQIPYIVKRFVAEIALMHGAVFGVNASMVFQLFGVFERLLAQRAFVVFRV